jgi:hypothetical protein
VLREKTLTATSDNVWKSYPHRADFDTHVAGPELQIGRDERSWSERAGSVHGLFDQVEALRLGCNVAQIRLPTPTTSAPIFVSSRILTDLGENIADETRNRSVRASAVRAKTRPAILRGAAWLVSWCGLQTAKMRRWGRGRCPRTMKWTK